LKAVCVVLCVLMLAFCLGACSTNNSIVGTWKHDTLGAAYEFTSDMQVIITLTGRNPVSGTFTLDKKTNTLVLIVEGQQQSGIIEIKGSTLKITSPDTGAVVTMTRVR
jgi:hypothetical protein